MKHAWAAAAVTLLALSADAPAAPASQAEAFAIVRSYNDVLRATREDLRFPEDDLTAVYDLLSVSDPATEPFAGATLIAGCRPQSCLEKAAALVEPATKTLLGVALLNFHCRFVVLEGNDLLENLRQKETRPATLCDDDPRLSIMVFRSARQPIRFEREAQTLAALRQWGARHAHHGEHVRVVYRGGAPRPKLID